MPTYVALKGQLYSLVIWKNMYANTLSKQCFDLHTDLTMGPPTIVIYSRSNIIYSMTNIIYLLIDVDLN